MTNPRLHWCLEAAHFLRGIGLDVRERDATQSLDRAFLPAVLVSHGGLVVDFEQAFPGDLLHEAGHLAILPEVLRCHAHEDLAQVEQLVVRYLQAHPQGLMTYPEDPFCRALMQASESEAIAWQYAAAVAMRLPDEWLFPPGSFEGNAEDLLLALKAGRHLGINGLRAAGWTQVPTPLGRLHAGVVYPELAFWLHPAQPNPQWEPVDVLVSLADR